MGNKNSVSQHQSDSDKRRQDAYWLDRNERRINAEADGYPKVEFNYEAPKKTSSTTCKNSR